MNQQEFLKNIFIVDALRTPIDSARKSLKNFSAADLASVAIKGILTRNHIQGKWIDQVILGNTVSAGAGQNLSRHAACLAGIPDEVPAFSVNHVCGSGLQAVILGIQAILCGDARMVLVGGTESASQSPLIVKNKSEDNKENETVESLIHDGLTCQIVHKHMGELAELIAEKYNITRQQQDQFACQSHSKALRVMDGHKFKDEIIPMTLNDKEFLTKDRRVRKNIDLEKLASLPAAFKKNGTVTAGNSSIPCDGAAVLLLASKEMIEKHKIKAMARILSYASVALDPAMVFTAAIKAVKTCLEKTQLKISDIDLFEISEAFAVQAIVTQRELRIPENKLNIYGGDVALGHPLGTAGARIFVTLLHALHHEKKSKGLAAVCLGGGGAIAIAVEAMV